MKKIATYSLNESTINLLIKLAEYEETNMSEEINRAVKYYAKRTLPKEGEQ